MGKFKDQHAWYVEHERELEKVVGEVVLYNLSPLMAELSKRDFDNGTDELSELYYTYENPYEDDGGEPEIVEALQHWLVSDWFADELKKKGEIVGEYAGLVIWGRTTCGQAISMDYVVQDVLKDVVENRRKYG